jgi:DNA repair exonuclease SbcCD nuclease subunit
MPLNKFLVCADVHLSDSPPRCRAGEKDWYVTQWRVLQQVNGIARSKGVSKVLVAGDLFHKPRVSPKLEALAIQAFQRFKIKWEAIPGQHDLPGHSMDSIDESSFNVLCQAGVLSFPHSLICSVPYGESIAECLKETQCCVAIAHELLWVTQPFPGAPDQGNALRIDRDIPETPCKLLFTGDNHQPFEYVGKNITIINCGSLMRRTADQEDHRPSVVLVNSDLSFERIYLDTSEDVFVVPENIKQESTEDKDGEMKAFLEALGDASVEKDLDLDNVLSVVYERKKTSESTRQLIKEIQNEIG